MLSVKELAGGYSDVDVLTDISFSVKKGELFGILGPNGSGKSTLLKMMSGILPFNKGTIHIKGKPIHQFSTKELAKMMAVLSQHSTNAFSYTVKETVALGRYAHQKSWFNTWSKEDEEIVQEVMGQTGILPLQNKKIEDLSGGEKQRVFLAQALAQQPEILLLDEPTNHLDLSYQKELLDHLKEWTKKKGLTVISIFHDLNIASLYCDRLLLLEKGKIHSIAVPNDMVKVEKINEVYQTEVEIEPHPQQPVPQMVLLPNWEEKGEDPFITPANLRITKEFIYLQSPKPLRTMATSVIGSGVGWYEHFLNGYIDVYDDFTNKQDKMVCFLKNHGLNPEHTVAMMTGVQLENVAYKFIKEENFSLLLVVTVGMTKAVDTPIRAQNSSNIGPVHTWIFINGELPEEAFIHSIMTATEAKVKTLEEQKRVNQGIGTEAIGAFSDNILIAATQRGVEFASLRTMTKLCKEIYKGVNECLKEAINKGVKV